MPGRSDGSIALLLDQFTPEDVLVAKAEVSETDRGLAGPRAWPRRAEQAEVGGNGHFVALRYAVFAHGEADVAAAFEDFRREE